MEHPDALPLLRVEREENEAHITPLAAFAERIRVATGRPVPDFDPLDGGVGARLLVLMESPSRKGIQRGFVSVDNPTPTGRRMRIEMEAAGIRRDERVIWNVVPWYLGDATKARNPTLAERREGVLWLHELRSLLPRLELVLTLGVPAREGWRNLGVPLPHIAAPHPSNTNLCARPHALEELRAALEEASERLHGDPR